MNIISHHLTVRQWPGLMAGALLAGLMSPGACQETQLNVQSGALAGKTLAGAGGETLGASVAATAFDMNSGLLVLAPRGGLTGGGTAYWIFNGSALTNPLGDPDTVIQQAFRISAAQDRDRLDDARQIGDFNNDGLPDIVLRTRPISSPTRATAYLVFGSVPVRDVELSTLPSAGGLVIVSDQASGPPGVFTLAGKGDFNGDGLADIVLGLPEGQGDASRSGLVFVLLGGNDLAGEVNIDQLPSSRLLTVRGRQFEGYLGDEVAFVGDVNQDGFDDLLLGSLTSEAYLIKGRPVLPSAPLRVADLAVVDGTTFSAQGALDSVASAGDFNGDGAPDLAFASTDPPLFFLPSARAPGAAYVVYGSPAMPAGVDLENLQIDQGLKATGFTSGDDVGTSLSGGGDLNGDGFDDLLIGAHLAVSPGPASFLLFGGPNVSGPLSLPSLPSTRGTALNPGGGAGLEQVPTFAGDLDGDGTDDLAVGDRLGAGAQGRVYTVRGNSQPRGETPGPAELLALIANNDSDRGLDLRALFEAGFVDLGDSLSGVAFLPFGANAAGEWQTQASGETVWSSLLAGMTPGTGVLYDPDTRLRFLTADPAAGFPPALSVSLWDGRGDTEFLSEVVVNSIAAPISPFSEPLLLSPPHVATIFRDSFEP